jgi:hypothetical protein
MRWASFVAATGVVVVAGSLVVGMMGDRDGRWSCDGVSMTAAQIAAARDVPVGKLAALYEKRDLTPDDICNMPAAKLKRALYKIDHPAPDHPGEAAQWRALRQKDEAGRIPLGGVARGLAHAAAMPAPEAPSADAPTQISRTNWTWLGPGNIGGRIRTIAFDPKNSNKIWIGAVAGGIWATTNGGSSWYTVGNFLANMAVTSIVLDPVTPSVMYAGTGEGMYNGDAARGAGILKSTNGGTNWAVLPSTTTADFQYVNRLALSPNGQVILAATRTGLFRSTDGGATWSKRLNAEVLDVRFHPTSNTAAVAGGRNSKAWRTTDGGVGWTAATGIGATSGFDGRVELTYARSSPWIVYASVDRNGGEVWKSTNGGASYILKSAGKGYLGDQGWYANTIWVSPLNPNLVVVGGLDLWRSTDGAATFTQISQWWSTPDSAHADHHFIASPPNFNGGSVRTVYFANDGGMYKAADVATVGKVTGWTELNNNLGVTQFYSAAINPTTQEVIGGTQDNGTLFFKPATGAQQWKETYGGDGGWSAADPKDPNYFYGEYVYLTLHRSADRGVSATEIWAGIDDANVCANFIAPFVLDPNNSQRLLAGGCSLWRTWSAKSSTPVWARIKPSNGDVPISAIAVAPSNSAVVYVGHNNGDVFRTSNSGATTPAWKKIITGLPQRYVTRITVSKTDPNVAYATFGGFTSPNVWKTTNGGTTWTAAAGSGTTSLPAVPVYSLVIHPTTPTTLYVGTEIGVFYSENGGSTWRTPSMGSAAVPVDELVFSGNVLYAATHGRGIFKSPNL